MTTAEQVEKRKPTYEYAVAYMEVDHPENNTLSTSIPTHDAAMTVAASEMEARLVELRERFRASLGLGDQDVNNLDGVNSVLLHHVEDTLETMKQTESLREAFAIGNRYFTHWGQIWLVVAVPVEMTSRHNHFVVLLESKKEGRS